MTLFLYIENVTKVKPCSFLSDNKCVAFVDNTFDLGQITSNFRYCTMRDCWAGNPLDRPSFSDLEARLGAMIGKARTQVIKNCHLHHPI